MPLETGTYITDLVPANPSATDGLSQGDDHIRLIKNTIKATFPNFTDAALQSAQAAIDAAVNAVVNGTVAAIIKAGTATAPGIAPVGDTDTGVYFPAEDQFAVACNGVQQLLLTTSALTTPGTASHTQGLVTTPGMVPIGAGLEWYSDTLPPTTEGVFAWQNGQAISRTTYATAYARIGTQFGAGDGTTTFNLPDKREVVTVGKSTMGGTTARGLITQYDPSVLGHEFGEAEHTLVKGEIPTGLFTLNDPQHSHTGVLNNSPSGAQLGPSAGSFPVGSTNPASTGITLTDHAGGGAHNIVQPTLVCNYIIRIA